MRTITPRVSPGGRFSAAIAAISAVVFVAPAVTAAPSATATPAPGPIAITTCELASMKSGYGMGNFSAALGHQTNFFRVVFTNMSASPADHVTFQIDFSKSRITIGDAGSYAPKASITQTFREKGKDITEVARPGGDGPIACTVLDAHFSDGTSWTSPAVAATPSPAP